MNDSILLIQSQDSTNSSMGTGFVIYQDEFGSYVLTCAHVVEQVVSPKIRNEEAVVRAIGSSDTVDLAVLYVKGLYAEPLKLQNKKSQTINVYLEGYSQFNKKKNQQKKREARILTSVNLEHKVDNSSYELLQIIAKDEYEIEAGNSGGPLICNESGKVIGVVSNNRGVKQGYAIAIKHLSDIGLVNLPPLLIENEENEESPFIGLSAFTMEEAHLFFGREQEINRIIRRLGKEDIIVVTGDSGSGKSSLIKAGVIPKYLNGVLGLDNNESFQLLSIRPAENPFMELSDAIIKLSEVSKMDFTSLNQIQEKILEKDKVPILNALKVIFKNQEFTTLLIFVDQFEELFRLDDKTQQEFLKLLFFLLKNKSDSLKIKLICTIRTDYFDFFSLNEDFFTLVKKSQYVVGRMKPKQIEECIQRPLEKTYIDKSQIAPFSKAVVADMDENPHELTLLQISLNETWRHRKKYSNDLLKTYHEIGEVSGALSKLAENTWNILTSSEKKVLEYILIRIVKPSDIGGATKRLAEAKEFSTDAWMLAEKLASSLDNKGKNSTSKTAEFGRLLKIKNSKNGDSVELTHEILVRKWTRYKKWLITVNKDNLKRIHDSMIIKSKYYHEDKDTKFLLTGYELDEGLRLLSGEYRKYLSDDEIVFIEDSEKKIKADLFRKRLLRSALYVALGVIVISLWQVEKQKDKVVSFLTQTTTSTVLLLEGKDNYTKHKSVNKTFTVIVNEFDGNNDKNISLMVLQAKFGKGITLRKMGEDSKAIEAYDLVIKEYGMSEDNKVLEFVAKALYNKARVLHKIIRAKEAKHSKDRLLYDMVKVKEAKAVYDELIQDFKNSKNPMVLVTVAKGWYNNASLNKSKKIAFELIEYFSEQRMSRSIKIEVLKAYTYIPWLYLLDKEYIDAQKAAKDGLKSFPNNHNLGLNLAHTYLLLEDIDKAKELYKKYRVTEKELSSDFRDFERVKIKNFYFTDIAFLLNNNKKGVENGK